MYYFLSKGLEAMGPIPDHDQHTVNLEMDYLTTFKTKNIPRKEEFVQIAGSCHRMAEVFYKNGARLWANELLSVAYPMLVEAGESAYDTAAKMIEYADHSRPDQYTYALWRFAAAQVRLSLSQKEHWLAAIDAVEIALACRPTTRDAHIGLTQDLASTLSEAEGTPLEPLMNAMVVMGDMGMDEARKIKAMQAFSGVKEEIDSVEARQTLELVCTMLIQSRIEDTRLGFLRKDQRTALTWHDLSLSHTMLHEAVPLGSAIVADIDRTAGFLLELAHEITHAYSLVGTIGKTRNVLRVIIHSCELLMRKITQEKSLINTGMQPTPELPQDPLNIAIAQVQFVTAWKTAVLEATWRPWLEGVAMYYELLCNPSEAPTEVLPVHEAIRSLIDIDLILEAGEENQKKNKLIIDEAAAAFDKFFSEALQRLSRLGHMGYALGAKQTTEAEKDIYLTGYLLVRSVISRWENTLGRRLLTVEAGKLLLDATRGDANQAMLPALNAPVQDFEALCRQHFMQWLNDLAALDKASLTAYMPFVDKHERGRKFYWDGGKLYADPDGDITEKRLEIAIDELHGQSDLLMQGIGIPEDQLDPEITHLLKRMSAGTREKRFLLTGRYWDLQTLMPVGKAMSKVNSLDSYTATVMFFTRSYIGDPRLEKLSVNANARYSIRQFELGGGAEEVGELTRLMAEQRLARVLTSKIIDLLQHGRGPFKLGPMSYTCHCIGKAWRKVLMFGNYWEVDDEHKDFKDLIIDRLYPSFFFSDEINNLSSFHFLNNRLRKIMGGEQTCGIHWNFDGETHARRIALDSCAAAFDSSPSIAAAALAAARKQRNAAYLLGTYLYETGCTGKTDLYDSLTRSAAAPCMPVFADAAAFSGIKPFKI